MNKCRCMVYILELEGHSEIDAQELIGVFFICLRHSLISTIFANSIYFHKRPAFLLSCATYSDVAVSNIGTTECPKFTAILYCISIDLR